MQPMSIDPALLARIEALRSSGKDGGPASGDLAVLKAKLAARERVPGYGQNVEALKAQIAQLEAVEAGETQ